MRWSHFSLVGLIGVLVFLAGTHLLWKSRRAAIAWVREFIRILRGEFARKNDAPRAAHVPEPRGMPRSGALVLVAAVALIVLGQILFFLDLTH